MSNTQHNDIPFPDRDLSEGDFPDDDVLDELDGDMNSDYYSDYYDYYDSYYDDLGPEWWDGECDDIDPTEDLSEES